MDLLINVYIFPYGGETNGAMTLRIWWRTSCSVPKLEQISARDSSKESKDKGINYGGWRLIQLIIKFDLLILNVLIPNNQG